MIELNITILIQLVNFIVALVVMNYLLISPVRKIIKQRRDLASGMLRDTEQFTSDATSKLHAYEAALANARENAQEQREASKAAALAQEVNILENAHIEAQKFLNDSRTHTRDQINSAMGEMRAKIPFLAEKAVAKLLGEKNMKKTGR